MAIPTLNIANQRLVRPCDLFGLADFCRFKISCAPWLDIFPLKCISFNFLFSFASGKLLHKLEQELVRFAKGKKILKKKSKSLMMVCSSKLTYAVMPIVMQK